MRPLVITSVAALACTAGFAEDGSYGLPEPYRSQLLEAHQLWWSNEFARALPLYTNLLSAPR